MNLMTTLQDAHIYIFKRWVIDFIKKNDKISSLRTDLLPVLAKMQWQSNLRKREGIDPRTSLQNITNIVLLEFQQSPQENSSDTSAMPINLQTSSPLSVSLFITSPSQYTLRANSLPTYLLLNHHQALLAPDPHKHPSSHAGPKTSVGQDSLVMENCVLGERVQIRKSVLSPGITVGSRTVIRGSVVMEGAKIGENVKLEGCVVCKGAEIGDKVSLTECFVGAGYVVEEGTKMAKQNLVELEELEDGSDEDDE
jgi:translation initiation factor eIF-2B subunit gamma